MPPVDLVESAVTSSRELGASAQRFLAAARREAPPFWEPGVGEHLRVTVEGAEIRVLHFTARDPAARRPVVMVPGFGATPEGFQDLYAALAGRAELFYLETREKPSSTITDPRVRMSVSRSARDVQRALEALGLAGRDFVLAAACWGSAIVLQGLIEGTVDAPTVLAADPMHAMWFPRWLLRWVSPLLPAPFLLALRPLVARAMLGDMKEPVQRQRAYTFAYSADPWKWKKSAEAAWDFELYGRLGQITREVFILNGTRDKIHDQRHYPRIAREMPRGRFIYVPAEEGDRERLFGAAALEFARVSAADGIPPSLAAFEKALRQEQG